MKHSSRLSRKARKDSVRPVLVPAAVRSVELSPDRWLVVVELQNFGLGPAIGGRIDAWVQVFDPHAPYEARIGLLVAARDRAMSVPSDASAAIALGLAATRSRELPLFSPTGGPMPFLDQGGNFLVLVRVEYTDLHGRIFRHPIGQGGMFPEYFFAVPGGGLPDVSL